MSDSPQLLPTPPLTVKAPRKPRAVDVELSNGEKIIVHTPLTKDLGLFINSLPSLTILGKAFETVGNIEEGVIGLSVNVSPEVLENLYPLLASMCDMSIDELKALELWDGMAVFTALNVLTPKNSFSPTEQLAT